MTSLAGIAPLVHQHLREPTSLVGRSRPSSQNIEAPPELSSATGARSNSLRRLTQSAAEAQPVPTSKFPRRARPTDLLAAIRSFDDGPKGCFAKAAYFAGRFNVSQRTIYRWIACFKKAGVLRVVQRGSTSSRFEIVAKQSRVLAGQNGKAASSRPYISPSEFILEKHNPFSDMKTGTLLAYAPAIPSKQAPHPHDAEEYDRRLELYVAQTQRGRRP